jgi:hypothetical protein
MGRDLGHLNFLSSPARFSTLTGDSMRSLISTTQCCGSRGSTRAPLACNPQIQSGDELPPAALPQGKFTHVPPVVAGALLSGEQLSFLEFLHDPAAADCCAPARGPRGDSGYQNAARIAQLHGISLFRLLAHQTQKQKKRAQLWQADSAGGRNKKASEKICAARLPR